MNASDVVPATGGVGPVRATEKQWSWTEADGLVCHTAGRKVDIQLAGLHQNADRTLNNTLVSSSSLPEFRLCEYKAARFLSYHKRDTTVI